MPASSPVAAIAMLRIAAAFLVVTLACPLLPLLSGRASGSAEFVALAGFTVPVAVFLGLPMLALLLWRGWRSWWQFGLGGAVIGAACVLPFAAGGPLLLLFLVPNFIAIGAVHGLAFWALGVWRNGSLERPAWPATGAAGCQRAPRGQG